MGCVALWSEVWNNGRITKHWAETNMAKLTGKQELFCEKLVETNNQSEAYRFAYSTSKMKTTTINVKACALAKQDNIADRVEKLRETHRKRHRVTVDEILGELEETRQIALQAETPQTSAAISASMGKAKLLGLDKQIIELSGPGGKPIQTQEIPDEELETKLRSLGLGRYHNQLGAKKIKGT